VCGIYIHTLTLLMAGVLYGVLFRICVSANVPVVELNPVVLRYGVLFRIYLYERKSAFVRTRPQFPGTHGEFFFAVAVLHIYIKKRVIIT
jgi:hypothetical protein